MFGSFLNSTFMFGLHGRGDIAPSVLPFEVPQYSVILLTRYVTEDSHPLCRVGRCYSRQALTTSGVPRGGSI